MWPGNAWMAVRCRYSIIDGLKNRSRSGVSGWPDLSTGKTHHKPGVWCFLPGLRSELTNHRYWVIVPILTQQIIWKFKLKSIKPKMSSIYLEKELNTCVEYPITSMQNSAHAPGSCFGNALVGSPNTVNTFGLSQPNTAWRVRIIGSFEEKTLTWRKPYIRKLVFCNFGTHFPENARIFHLICIKCAHFPSNLHLKCVRKTLTRQGNFLVIMLLVVGHQPAEFD